MKEIESEEEYQIALQQIEEIMDDESVSDEMNALIDAVVRYEVRTMPEFRRGEDK